MASKIAVNSKIIFFYNGLTIYQTNKQLATFLTKDDILEDQGESL